MTGSGPALRFEPFQAVRYAPGIDLASVTCPPYDMISGRTREEFRAADPYNIVHLTLPAGGDHSAAAEEFRRWLAEGVLRREPVPACYVYEHRTVSGSAVGLVGGVGLDGPILPHENTFSGPVADRAALMTATGAQLEPILLTYEGDGPASGIVDAVTATMPERDIGDGTGAHHRVWRITDSDALTAIADDLATRTALIADGHHRFAAYQAVHAETPGPGTAYGLALLVDAARHPLRLHGIHRSIAQLPFDQAVALAAKGFESVDVTSDDPTYRPMETSDDPTYRPVERGTFVVTGSGRRAVLRTVRQRVLDEAVPPGRPEGWRDLDAAVLTDVVMTALWTIGDDDRRVEYHHDVAEAIDTADRTGGVAVLVAPPRLGDIHALAARGGKMPRKSTSFGPKPWTGLFIRETHR